MRSQTAAHLQDRQLADRCKQRSPASQPALAPWPRSPPRQQAHPPTMKETKPVLRPRRRCSSSRGHMTLTLPMGPNRPNSRISTWYAQVSEWMNGWDGAFGQGQLVHAREAHQTRSPLHSDSTPPPPSWHSPIRHPPIHTPARRSQAPNCRGRGWWWRGPQSRGCPAQAPSPLLEAAAPPPCELHAPPAPCSSSERGQVGGTQVATEPGPSRSKRGQQACCSCWLLWPAGRPSCRQPLPLQVSPSPLPSSHHHCRPLTASDWPAMHQWRAACPCWRRCCRAGGTLAPPPS